MARMKLNELMQAIPVLLARQVKQLKLAISPKIVEK